MNTLNRMTAHGKLRGLALTIYYIAILAGLVLLYGRGGLTMPPFVYQGF